MFCPECGTRLEDGSTNCINCGWHYPKNIEIQENQTIEDNVHEDEKNPPVENSKNTEEQEKEKLKVPNKESSRKKIRIVVIVAILIVAAAGVYCQTDTYKYNKAEKYLLEGDKTEVQKAMSMMEKMSTQRAVSMRQYAEVAYTRACFMEYYADDFKSAKAGSDIAEALDNFSAAFSEFESEESYNFLPEKLKIQYNLYRVKLEDINEQYGDAHSYFYDAQRIFLNRVTRNRDTSYAVQEQQDNIDISETAYNWIVSHLSKEGNADTSEEDMDYSCELLNDFVNSVESEIQSEEEKMEKTLEEFDITDTLYLVEPNKIYASYVCEGLDYVVTTNDISDNASTLMYSIKIEILAECFKNSSV